MRKGKKFKYLEALKELDDILEFLQAEIVDVEVLSSKIKRAVELVEYCRRKINSTETEVKKVLEKFQKSEGDTLNGSPEAD